MTSQSSPYPYKQGKVSLIALPALGSAMWAVGDFEAKSRNEGEKRNGNRYINNFYSLAVEAGFYGDEWLDVGFSTKISNVDSG